MQPGIQATVRPEAIAEPVQDDLCPLPAELAGLLRDVVGEWNFQRWFEGRCALNLTDSTLRVAVPAEFQQSWMQRRFGRVIGEALRNVDPALRIDWVIDPASESGSAAGSLASTGSADRSSDTDRSSNAGCNGHGPGRAGEDADRNGNTAGGTPHRSVPASPGRDTRRFARLDRFVPGTCNELALTAARQVCLNPGERINPLYLHGPVGTGKTHLAEGICAEIRRLHSGLYPVFMTAEQFANQFTQALRTHALPGFRQRFRTIDVLIVDDVSFLDGKRVIQEEFLHTFQQLVSHGRQVIVTADCHPRLMSRVSEELTTRFLSGLVCRLEAPDPETRRKIVRAKAADLSVAASDEALDYVARRFVHNVRELEGALHTLAAWHAMTRQRVSLQTARQVLSELERDCIRVVRLADIEAAVCRLFGVDPDALRSTARTRTVSQPRMLAMFLARRHTQSAYKEIGEFFGGRNHSTVVAAEKKVELWLRSATELSVGGRRWHLSDVIETLEQQLLAG